MVRTRRRARWRSVAITSRTLREILRRGISYAAR
jgi:hypothetical protein